MVQPRLTGPLQDSRMLLKRIAKELELASFCDNCNGERSVGEATGATATMRHGAFESLKAAGSSCNLAIPRV